MFVANILVEQSSSNIGKQVYCEERPTVEKRYKWIDISGQDRRRRERVGET